MENLKRCIKCGEEKELNKFHKHPETKDGRNSYCKKCVLRQAAEWRENNPEKIKENHKKWYINNREKIIKIAKQWAENNPEKVRKNQKKWRKQNLEKINERSKKYYQNNLEKEKERSRKYRQNNPEKRKESYKKWYDNNLEYYKKRRKNNPKKVNGYSRKWAKNNRKKINKHKRDRKKIDIHYKLRLNISALIYKRLKHKLLGKNGKSTWSFLPYTVDDLIKHLESLFQPWMNWGNYGEKAGCWVIDHKKPDSLFHYTSVEDKEFQKCWALSNLQPLEYIENIKKSDKLIYE